MSAWYPAGGPLARLVRCCRQPFTSTVDVLHQPEHKNAVYRGLQTCGSPWACPVCAAKIAIRRREELRAGIAAHEAAGGRVALVTYTIRHKRGDDLPNMLRAMGAARRELKSGRQAAAVAASFGLWGSVRALEFTHGVNGWHPHYHELVFLSRAPDAERLRVALLALWSAAVVRAGLRDITERGVDVVVADWSIAEYVTKFGHERVWGLESELALGAAKGRSPAQLLAGSMAGDVDAGRLWLQYAETTKGQRQLWWTQGLRGRLGLAADKTDDELASEVGDDFAVLMASLTRGEWLRVLGNDVRAELLNVAATGDHAQVAGFLAGLGLLRFRPAGDHRCAPARPISAGAAAVAGL